MPLSSRSVECFIYTQYNEFAMVNYRSDHLQHVIDDYNIDFMVMKGKTWYFMSSIIFLKDINNSINLDWSGFKVLLQHREEA